VAQAIIEAAQRTGVARRESKATDATPNFRR